MAFGKEHHGKQVCACVCGIVRGNLQPVLPWSLSERKTWVFPHQGKLDAVHRGPLRLLRRHEAFMAGLLQKEALCKEDPQVSVQPGLFCPTSVLPALQSLQLVALGDLPVHPPG